MLVFFLGTSAVHVAALVLIGIYTATRKEGRRDIFGSGGVRLAAVAVVALLSVLPTDVLSIVWLTLLQDRVEVTANLFMLVSPPVVAVLVAVQAMVLARVYRLRPLLYGAVYLGVYALAYSSWLRLLFNPPADIARYAAVILGVGSLVMAFFVLFVWRDRQNPEAG